MCPERRRDEKHRNAGRFLLSGVFGERLVRRDMAKEYIEREAFDRELQNLVKEYNRNCESERSSGAFEALYKLRLLPAADVVEVVHGEWIVRFDGRYSQRRTYCSICGNHSGIGGNKQEPNYCPNCGAKMDGERKEV
jgi:hypothetical protein